jgi:hypothetical protein
MPAIAPRQSGQATGIVPRKRAEKTVNYRQ